MGEWKTIENTSGVSVPVCAFMPEGQAKAAMLLLPALGVQARFYRRLAEGLAAAGIVVCLFEQRGHGESPYRAARGQSFGLKAFLEDDIPAAIRHTQALLPGTPFFLGGHSLGGHLSSITAGTSDQVAVPLASCTDGASGLLPRRTAGFWRPGIQATDAGLARLGHGRQL